MISKIKESLRLFKNHNGAILAAALAFIILLNSIPLLILFIFLSAFFFENTLIFNSVSVFLQHFTIPEISQVIRSLIMELQKDSSVAASLWSIIVLAFGSGILFVYFKKIMYILWDISAPPKKKKVKRFIFNRIISACYIITSILFFWVGLLVFSFLTVINVVFIESQIGSVFFYIITDIVLFFLISALITFFYYIITNRAYPYKRLLKGGIFTMGLLILGQILFSAYLEYSSFSDIYSLFESLFVIMFFVYYLSIAFIFGAQYTFVDSVVNNRKEE